MLGVFVRAVMFGGVFLSSVWCCAAEQVEVVIGPEPPKLVRFAADELAGQFKKLFDAEVTIVAKPSDKVGHRILLGSPDTNPAIPREEKFWQKVSEQGIVLRSVELPGGKALIVGGGGPVATLWAVYELGQHFGVRYLLREDVFPANFVSLNQAGINVVLEPTFHERAWTIGDASAIGACAWPAAEYQKLVRQLAKLKFNRLRIVRGYPPFVVESATSCGPLFGGEKFPIDGDSPGRKAFNKGDKEFFNTDFVGKSTPEETCLASLANVKSLHDLAEALGMQHSSQPVRTVRNGAHMTLTSDAVGMLPQSHLQRISDTLASPRWGVSSWYTHSLLPGDADVAANLLSRGSFGPATSVTVAVHDLFDGILGRPDVTDRLILALQKMEAANDLIEKECPGIAAPKEGVLLARLNGPNPGADKLKDIAALYKQSTDELYRAHDNCLPSARRLLYYHCKRGEYAMHFLAGVQAIDLAAEARRKKDHDAQIEQLEKAVEAFYNAFDALGPVARDPSDRAVIAVGNKYIFRPLVAELERVSDAAN